ncbi:MAG: hypothetical protein ACXWCM_16120 [Acidimicrobiales bacterium]
MGRGPERRGRERGAGLIGTIAGVLVFLAFLLFAVQLLIDLYATSAATSAAFDGARLVAGSRTDHATPDSVARAQAEAERRMRDELGELGDRVTFDWTGSDGDVVAVRVQGPAPRFLLPGLGGPLGFDTIDRTARVRVEVAR